jgi:hypothetical protein
MKLFRNTLIWKISSIYQLHKEIIDLLTDLEFIRSLDMLYRSPPRKALPFPNHWTSNKVLQNRFIVDHRLSHHFIRVLEKNYIISVSNKAIGVLLWALCKRLVHFHLQKIDLFLLIHHYHLFIFHLYCRLIFHIDCW